VIKDEGRAMKGLVLIPHRILRPYIRHYVYCEIGDQGKWMHVNSAPPGCTALVVTCGVSKVCMKEAANQANTYESVAFSGQTTSFKQIFLYDRLRTFFVIFQPWGAYRLLGIHQGECENTYNNLTDLLGTPAKYLKTELASKTEPYEIMAVVERFFLKQIARVKKSMDNIRLANVVEQIRLHSHQSSLIKNICHQEGYSMSKLERHMKRIVGITPKQYQRIIRFNMALQYISRNSSHCNWSWIADRFGYFDQAHFIKEFKFFYGKTPGSAEQDQFLSSIAYRKQVQASY